MKTVVVRGRVNPRGVRTSGVRLTGTKSEEARIRRMAKRRGLVFIVSRRRGNYALTNSEHGWLVTSTDLPYIEKRLHLPQPGPPRKARQRMRTGKATR